MAFRTQKISQMTPKGANLEATDLIEVSTIESGSYVTRSITGQEIIDAAVGNVDWGDIGGTLSAQTDLQNALDAKQDDITLTTTGSSGASTLVGSTLNVPNYTLSGLGGVPTSRTLTINGVTQDLSADRTFTISTGITIGTTAIASGVVGRVLFEGAGNVVQESSSLFWDATNNRLGIGTSSPAGNVDINASFATTGYPLIVKNTGYFNAFFQGTSANNQASFYLENDRGSTLSYGGFAIGGSTSTLGNIFGLTRADRLFMFADGPNIAGYAIGTLQNVPLQFGTNNAIRATIFANGNIGVNTTTDAGFRLDVNGTARVSTSLTILSPNATQNAVISHDNSDAFITLSSSTNSIKFNKPIRPLTNNNVNIGDWNSNWNQIYARQFQPTYGSATFVPYGFTDGLANAIQTGMFGGTGFLAFSVVGTEAARFAATTRNLLINTTTDAGFRLDVNGTARVQGNTTVTGSISLGTNQSIGDGNFSVNVNRLESYNAYRIRTLADNRYVYLSPGNTDILYANYWAASNFAGVVVQDVAGTTQSTSAVLQANSTTRGFLPPRMTTTQKNAIASPAAGLMVYDTTLNVISYYNGTMWI